MEQLLKALHIKQYLSSKDRYKFRNNPIYITLSETIYGAK